MKMVDFLFVYEHVNREIENNILIMEELKRRGYKCRLISFFGPDYVSWRLLKRKAKVVIVPWLRYDEDLRRFISLAARPYRIVNSQCEQVTNEFGRPGMDIVSKLSKNAYYFCWGNKRREELIENGIRDTNIRVVGAVQQDYGRKRMNRYYKGKNKIASLTGLNPNKKWILFISSFSGVCWSSDAVERASRVYGDGYCEFHKLEVESQKNIIEWLKKLCVDDGLEIIYRPHPSETNSNLLCKTNDEYSNFHIINDYSVKQWATICESVNLWISTSNAELYSMGIRYNVLRPCSIPGSFDMPTFIGDEFITDYTSFDEIVYNGKTNKDYIEKVDNYREKTFLDYYSYDKNKSAYKRNADALEEIYKAGKTDLDTKGIGGLPKYSLFFFKDIIKSILIKIDVVFPKIHIIEKIPFSDDTKNLLRTRSYNYKAKDDSSDRMKKYLLKHVEKEGDF